MIWLILAQFAVLVTNAYAQQVDRDVVVSVTYTSQRPVRVCVSDYALSDSDMEYPLETRCWTPKSDICDMDVWHNQRLDTVNFLVTVSYPDGQVDVLPLIKRINT